MNFLGTPKGLPRLWSCLLSDYEVLLNQYMTSEGWKFSHFAKCAKEMQITLLYHASIGHGRKRDEQHECIGEMILNTAKELWLHPGKLPEIENDGKMVADDESSQSTSSASASTSQACQASTSKDKKDVSVPERARKWKSEFKEMGEFEIKGLDVGLKYQLGAFYLTYIMYERQPYAGLLKIKMTPKDFVALKKFNDDLEKYNVPSLLEEYWFMLQRLRMNQAFVVTAFPDKYDIAPTIRALLNCKNNEMFELVKADRRIMDVLAYSTVSKETADCFKKYMNLKQEFLNGSACAPIQSTPEALAHVSTYKDSTLLGTLISHDGVADMVKVAAIVKEMTSKPLFTHAALLGNDLTSQVFVNEAKKKLKRLEAKQNNSKDPVKVTKPYSTGGVFSNSRRNEEDDDDERPIMPKGRAATSDDLWNYIKGKGYVKGKKVKEEAFD